MSFNRKGSLRILSFLLVIMILGSIMGCSKEKEGSYQKEAIENPLQKESITAFTGERNRRTVDVPYEPVKFTTQVKPYQVKEDLSNIVNLNQFGEFTPEQQQLIAKNGFVVVPSKEEQLFYIYENNEYKKLPSFITTDSVLQVYHVFFDYSLRTLESEKLLGILEELTESMYKKSLMLYGEVTDQELKNVLIKNMAFFAVGLQTLEKPLPVDLPAQARKIAVEEYQLIQGEQGYALSAIFPYDLDYSQYKPRGHYTRSKDLERFFRTMMWYGQAPFPLYKDAEGTDRNVEQTLQALLLTYSLFMENGGTPDVTRWENIYDPTVFYVGNTDDLNIYHYLDLILKIYGKDFDLNELNHPEKLDAVYQEAQKLPEPKIKAKYTSVTTPVGKQFRLMGQRYIPDSEAIQELTEPIERPIPSGLDVMAVLGSQRAYDLAVKELEAIEKWPGYEKAYKKYKEEFSRLPDKTWRSNMYYGWLWVVKSLLKPFDQGYPSFMTNQAWADKSLSTALSSWAELRHDTILYGKQSGAECGGGEEPPQVRGYVEPNIEVYEKLLWLTRYSRANLQERNILTGSLESKMQRFEDLLQFLINCSIKQLRNEELAADEYYQLLTYGGMLEYLTSSFAGDDGMRWFEITSDTDKNMAVIADIHTIAPNAFSPGGYFHVAVGPAHEIYVVVPIGEELQLTRGAVFSYYEFDATERFNDEQWQKMLKENKAPGQPGWLRSFINGAEKDIPLPANPFSSGC
ncbi:DUF3160 domain-containing protein [Geosporobacter ferrireducens]|uniref:YARHG domain-containing protein n=1 Tax=Geosporobacter ferrireducens TaxID=1424294 RepID=A0A1D8GNR0_9FIRM|nr:DUF3160 domain-containing protein [Geosporobacter ferrireducens]AOT72512.1 hypothetical protein Gferi_24945 [Geosporobacter ferrireducens]